MKKLSALFLAAGMVLCLASCGGGSSAPSAATPAPAGNPPASSAAASTPPSTAQVTFRLGVAQEDSNPYSKGAYQFSDLVKEKTNGRIQIDVYTGGQLGGESDMTESVSLGTLDICLTSNAPLTNFSPRFNLFELPYLFMSYEQIDKVLDGEVGRELLDDLSSINVKGLAYFENGFRNLTNSKREINAPADLKGLKIRTMESAMHIAAFTALGANPTPMAWGEVYTALQQGTIDGQENPGIAIKGQKIYEVNKYLSITEHVYTPVELIMNQGAFEKLSPEDQAIVLACAQEAATFERKICREVNADLSFFEQQGMIISHPDKQPFQDIAKTIWKDYEGDLGDLISRVQALQ